MSLGAGYSTGYGYASNGRFETLSWNVNGDQDSATYTRVPGSELLAGHTTGSGLGVSYGYEPQRDLKTQVANRKNGSLVSQYDYAYDAIGRRTSVVNTGSAFAAAAHTAWGYDERNQVTASNRYLGTNPASTTNPVNAEQRAFAYDPIGNRETSTAAGVQTSYGANELNQYESVGSEEPSYDEDGNLFNDGTKVLTYNGENQLRTVTVPGVSTSTYDYDYIGRRVRKSVDLVTGTDYSVTWVYSGWNKVEERKTVGSTTTVKNFVWGLDLSQSIEGAGGIGGLLAVVDDSGSASLFSYDANGNVSELVAADSGATSAHYEYDAFGNVITPLSGAAAENSYRFSTKYADDETGLVYYGYRYYSPAEGRWVNRDPIGEQGGVDLYGFVGNRPVSRFDMLGLVGFATGSGTPALPRELDQRYGTQEPSIGDYGIRAAVFVAAQVAQVSYPDAAAALLHFLAGSGTQREIDLYRLVREVPSAKATMDSWMADSVAFALTLKDGDRFHATETFAGRLLPVTPVDGDRDRVSDGHRAVAAAGHRRDGHRARCAA